MNKLIAFCSCLLFTAIANKSNSQVNNNKFPDNTNGTLSYSNQVNKVFFTPQGILQCTESGGSKSIKAEAAPVVIKKNMITSAIEESNLIIQKLTGLQFKYAMMLDVDVESLKDLSLLGLIDNWFGTKYKFGGTTKKGVDCSSLTSTFLLTIYGFAMPRTARQQYRATTHISKNELKQGDLVFFNTHGGVSHVGLYLANNYFIHASSSHGVTISNLDDNYYAKRFICGGRVEED